MSRRKLQRVEDFDKAKTRLASMKSISPTLDLGNGITIANYEVEVNKLTTKLNAYNTALSSVDGLYNDCIAQINILKDWNERALTGVATKYGKNSSEYEMAGGTRKPERKKSNKNATAKKEQQ